jgi:hypothetical protein
VDQRDGVELFGRLGRGATDFVVAIRAASDTSSSRPFIV